MKMSFQPALAIALMASACLAACGGGDSAQQASTTTGQPQASGAVPGVRADVPSQHDDDADIDRDQAQAASPKKAPDFYTYEQILECQTASDDSFSASDMKKKKCLVGKFEGWTAPRDGAAAEQCSVTITADGNILTTVGTRAFNTLIPTEQELATGQTFSDINRLLDANDQGYTGYVNGFKLSVIRNADPDGHIEFMASRVSDPSSATFLTRYQFSSTIPDGSGAVCQSNVESGENSTASQPTRGKGALPKKSRDKVDIRKLSSLHGSYLWSGATFQPMRPPEVGSSTCGFTLERDGRLGFGGGRWGGGTDWRMSNVRYEINPDPNQLLAPLAEYQTYQIKQDVKWMIRGEITHPARRNKEVSLYEYADGTHVIAQQFWNDDGTSHAVGCVYHVPNP